MKPQTIILTSLLVTLAACTVDRPPITEVAEVAFYTENLSASQSFYGDYLGYEQAYVFTTENGDTSSVSYKINDRQLITLIPDQTERESLLAWYLLETPKLRSMRKYLISKGIDIPESIETNRFGNRQFLLTDPAGHRMGFVQVLPGSTLVRDEGTFLSDRRVADHMSHVGFGAFGKEEVQNELAYYLDILGFEQGFTIPAPPEEPTVIHMKMPDSDGRTVELLPYYSPINKTQLASRNHICLELEDIYPAAGMLQERRGTAPYIRTGQNRKRTMDPRDYNGTRAEIMERLTVDEQAQQQE